MGLSAKQFDCEGGRDGAERQGTTVDLEMANCGRPEIAGMELPVVNDQLPVKVKGDARSRTHLLMDTGVVEGLFIETGKSQSQNLPHVKTYVIIMLKCSNLPFSPPALPLPTCPY